MPLEKIKEIKIPIAENAVLYLWATAPKLLEALAVMKSWGFKYRTQMIWDKEIIGCGWWFRGQHEILLVGVKGKFSPPAPSMRVSSVLRKRRTRHSEKPRIIRGRIKRWFPNVNRIELFAREKVRGWDAWGNEVESDIKL